MPFSLDRRVLVTAALSLFSRKAFAARTPTADRWRRAVDGLCGELKSGALTAADWQLCMESLYWKVDLAALVRELALERLAHGLAYPERLGAVADVPLAPPPAWGHRLFSYRAGAQTPPHAHNNVASAHVVLWGQIRVRTWHRVADEPGHLILEPTRDVIAFAGDVITMSDDRDNVHAFTGLTPASATLDVAVSTVDPARRYATPAEGHGQIFVDPTAPADSHGRIAAPIIPFSQAASAAPSSREKGAPSTLP